MNTEEDNDFLAQVAKTVYLAAGYGIGEAMCFRHRDDGTYDFAIGFNDMAGSVRVSLNESTKRPHIVVSARFVERSRFGAYLYLINDLVKMLENHLLGNFTFDIDEFQLLPEEE